MPPEERDILLWHYVEGQTLREIARSVGITKSGAHVRLTQARARFAEKFQLLQSEANRERSPAMFAGLPLVLAALRALWCGVGSVDAGGFVGSFSWLRLMIELLMQP